MWDNRQTKKNPKQPDYKCKDKDGCGKGVWEKRSEGSGTGGASNGGGNARSARPLGPLYYESLRIASESVKKLVPNAQPADIIAAAATVFIGATNTGAPLMAPKAKPAPPPPPPPKPEPEPEEYFESADLPF